MTLNKVLNTLARNTKKNITGYPIMQKTPDFAITEETQAKKSQKMILG